VCGLVARWMHGLFAVGERSRGRRELRLGGRVAVALGVLSLVGAALPAPAAATDPVTVQIGNGPTSSDGTYRNAQEIADNLVFTNIGVVASSTIEVVDDIDLSTSDAGIPSNNLHLIAPTIRIVHNVTLSSFGRFFLTGDTLDLDGRLTSDGTPVDPARVTGTATQVNVLGPAASIQQAIDLSSRTAPVAVQVGAGQYEENLVVSAGVDGVRPALTLTGNVGEEPVGADPDAPELFGAVAGGKVVTVTADHVAISGLHLNASVAGGSSADSLNSVFASGVDDLTISHNTLEGFSGTGIATPGSSNVILEANLIVPPVLVSIAVFPADSSIAKGTDQQFTAVGTYSDDSNVDLTGSVVWASDDPGVATISSTGLAHGVDEGTSTISATLGDVSGETLLTVGPPTLDALAVLPADPSIGKGTDLQFSAIGTFSDDSNVDLTGSVEWASDNPAVATISSTGLAHGVDEGTSTISATLGDVSGQTLLTVGPAPAVLLYKGPTNTVSGASITLKATLKTSSGQKLAGRVVSFTLDGVTRTATTKATGVASVKTKAPTAAGVYTISIEFAGDPDHGATSITPTLTVAQNDTVLIYTGPTSALPGAPITLKATLKTASGKKLAGKLVSFTLDGVTKTGTTRSTGVASVKTTAPSTPGEYPISIEFAGDASNGPTSTTATLTIH
jgi:hypothetical protein